MRNHLMTLFCCAFLSTASFSAPSAGDIGQEIRKGNLLDLAEKTDRSLSHMIHFSAAVLRRKGFEFDAVSIETEYAAKFDGFVTAMVLNPIQDIGDHKPLSEWLANVMKTLEADLGFNVCKMLHLTDIDVLNYGIPVVFHPCTFPMDNVPDSRELEYSYHFAKSPKYGPALVPVVSYWLTEIVCSVATYGTGSFMLCSPIATGVEDAMEFVIAPPLSNLIFERSCQ